VARLDGRSSWGRLGIIIHSTAGSVQPGYAGQLTLEIANISKVPVKLWPGAKICQITFEMLSSPCEIAYGERNSKYMDQQGPEMSKISMDPSLNKLK
jgi:dCTP deaminase